MSKGELPPGGSYLSGSPVGANNLSDPAELRTVNATLLDAPDGFEIGAKLHLFRTSTQGTVFVSYGGAQLTGGASQLSEGSSGEVGAFVSWNGQSDCLLTYSTYTDAP